MPPKLINVETKSKICGLIVVVGLVIETIVELIYRKDASNFEIGFRLFANILIAGGVFGEVFFSHRVTQLAEKEKRESDEKIAEANARAEEAILKQKELEEKIAILASEVSNNEIMMWMSH